jgi:hypothetical protein
MNDDLSHQMQLAGELGVTEARLEAALRRIAELEAERDALVEALHHVRVERDAAERTDFGPSWRAGME